MGQAAHDPGAASSPGLRAEGVAIVRGGREVARELALRVAPGSVVVLMAPSGSGKSSLLRCCTGLLVPAAGTIELHGTPVGDLDPRTLRRRVGLVAQQPVMLPGSVGENVRYATTDLAPDAVEAALDRAGLPRGFARRTAAELSGGERARVALARALVRTPDVLLLDEPTAALDASLVARLAETLRELAADGPGVLVATHERAFAELVGCVPVDLRGAAA